MYTGKDLAKIKIVAKTNKNHSRTFGPVVEVQIYRSIQELKD